MQAALIILDGWGLGDHDRRDAVKAANTPVFDRVAEQGAYGTLNVSGRDVGLPEGQMGNSEVGHLNIGAGRVVKQPFTKINDAIAAGELDDNNALLGAIDGARDRGGRVHFMGLVSDGGVHSSQQHLHALIDLAAERGATAVTHAFTDGRDTDPDSGAGYVEELEAHVAEAGTGDVATLEGRYWAMDRDTNWERTKKAYDAIVAREAEYEAESGLDAVSQAYDRDETDEFIEPTLIEGQPALEDGDAVVFFNFRPDRARQLVRMLTNTEPDWEYDLDPPEIDLATLTEYDETFDFPVAFPPDEPEATLGSTLADNGRTQLRTAESEKYPHVTYFLNGGREVAYEGELRNIVESPDVPTYDRQPEMSAAGVTDQAIEIVDAEDPDVLVLNYANPDMVGHTGDFGAAIAAVETVDEQLGRLLGMLEDHGAHVLITADHGNADDMGTEDDPHTAHTTNPVPFVSVAPSPADPDADVGDPAAVDRTGGFRVRDGGRLADITPTILALLGIDQPPVMTGESLLVGR
ncbi:phosphoglyceromutase [Salinarchaeum sp. Harcht-Bsk1]|uniref:2,3-bisphosphoglycerate-independent phosphoglycerate mutase n=1 Tax=Salinarchaeum sp. Harcht-Bsk1 TaxID=1333523 RepID=UPI0003423914|nr:2,3-bisphosphoglycerate-independent phosphoglycerate mutase [Salinarchaeum sp. Harcht-Bsk1]AGN02264.1 phosphoglyceromutase [Salinarchaeum sp. Harcht-Bsk1]